MKKSILELTVDILVKRQRMLKDELRQRFKKTKPFMMEPVSEDKMLEQYMATTPEDMSGYIQTYGEDTVNEMIGQMEALKEKRGYA